MKKKRKTGNVDHRMDLWVAPKHSFKGANGERAWDTHLGGPPSTSRFLELADIALGLKKKQPPTKRKS